MLYRKPLVAIICGLKFGGRSKQSRQINNTPMTLLLINLFAIDWLSAGVDAAILIILSLLIVIIAIRFLPD